MFIVNVLTLTLVLFSFPLLSLPFASKVLLFSLAPIVLASLKFFSTWNHTLLMLLTLEVLMLLVTFNISYAISTSHLPIETIFVFFTFAVVEASVGVAVLVSFSRSFGKENLSLLLLN